MIYGTPEFNTLLLDIIKRDKRHDMYGECCDLYDKMAVHIYGKTPTEILERTRPSEPVEVKQYRIDNYEPTTKATASKAISILMKIFNTSLSEIRWKEQTPNGQKLQKYALEYYPVSNSVIKFMAEAGIKKMIADPNGIIAIRPLEMPENELIEVQPIIKLYGSKSIWWKDLDFYLIHLKEEKPKIGIIHYFTYYDKNSVIDFNVLIENSESITLTETFVYNHLGKEIPVWELQGELCTSDEGEEYFKSYFDAAVPFWNLAITHDSDVFGSYIRHIFPQKVELAEDCEYIYENQRCSQGKITMPEGKSITCPGCNGTGYRRSSGPYGVYQVSKSKLDGPQSTTFQPVQYITVPIDATKMLEERVDRLHEKGLNALNMDIINRIGENQSGVAKVIDRGELYDFLYKIASVVYDTHFANIFYFFNKYMFQVQDANPGRELDKNLPEINKPTKFDIASTPEMIEEYKVSKDSGVSAEYLRQKQISISAKEYSNNPDVLKRIIMTIELDPLPGIKTEDADTLLMSGLASKRDLVIHFNIGRFVERALIENTSFYGIDKNEKIEKLNEYADLFIKENTPTLDTSAIDT
jgi:hypothetical protein